MDHRFSQKVRESRSSWATSWPSSVLMVLLYIVSSANRQTLDMMLSGRPFMYRRKRTRPRTEP